MAVYILKNFKQFPGNPKIQFAQPIADTLICVSCKNVSSSLIRDAELRGYCRSCSQGRTALYTDETIWSSLKETIVCCPYKEYDCTHVDSLESTAIHSQNCPKKRMPCPLQCGRELVPTSLVVHLRDDCSERILTCRYCRGDQRACKLQSHENECPDRPVNCQYCGLALNKQKFLPDHHSVCNLKTWNCKFETFGCTYQGTRTELKRHEDSGNHTTMLIDQIKELHGKCKILEKERESEEEKRKSMEKKFEVVQKTLNENLDITDSMRIQLQELIDMNSRLQNEISDLTKPKPISNVVSKEWILSPFRYLKGKETIGSVNVCAGQTFYTGHPGYKLRALINLNGRDDAHNTYMSFNLQIQQGDYDHIVPWPFCPKVTLVIKNQRHSSRDYEKVIDPSAVPEDMKPCLRKPVDGAPNLVFGMNKFILLQTLEDPSKGFLHQNSIILCVLVSPIEKDENFRLDEEEEEAISESD